MALGIEQLADFIHAVQQSYVGQPRSWQDISLPLQQYQFASRIINKVKKEEKGGAYIKWKIRTDNDDNFQVVGLYHRDSSNRRNVMDEGSQKWAMTTVNYHYDLDEQTFKDGEQEIIDYVKLREDGLMIDFYKGMETLMFGDGPTSPTQSPFAPCSLLWWIQANATEGFNGGEPSGFDSVGTGGIDTDTYPNWKNRTFSYAAFTHDDAVKKVIRSMDKCQFKPPIPLPDIVPQDRPNWELLTTYSRIEAGRELLAQGNDNIKLDLATYRNEVLIRGVPMVDVSAWSNSESTVARTDGPILGIDWSTFKWYYQRGRSMRKSPPYQHPEMSNVRIRKMDSSGQLVCFSRRNNFRGYSTSTVTEVQ